MTQVTVFGIPKGRPTSGPTHLMQAGFYGLSWCGVKSQFRHWLRPADISEVDCPKCLTQIRKDQPKAWRSR